MREVADQVGGFGEMYPGSDELDHSKKSIGRKLTKLACRAALAPQATYYHQSCTA